MTDCLFRLQFDDPDERNGCKNESGCNAQVVKKSVGRVTKGKWGCAKAAELNSDALWWRDSSGKLEKIYVVVWQILFFG